MTKHFSFHVSPLGFILSLLSLTSAAQAQRPVLKSGSRFGPTHAVPQTPRAPSTLLERLAQQNPAALSVTAADFYLDSTKTLVTGYALGSGGVLSIQGGLKVLPRVEEMAAKAPFQPDANYLDIGLRPDFLKSDDLNGDGRQDLIVASRGGSSVRVLLGDGKGSFTPQSPIPVDGEITALMPIRSATGRHLIAVAVCGNICSVNLFEFNGTPVASIPVDDKITILDVARFNGTASEDIIAGGSSKLVLIDGQSAFTTSPRIDRLPVSGAISAIDGGFVYDARGYRQIAVLTNDGTLHTLARSGIIPQPPVFERNRDLPRAHRSVRPARVVPSTLSWVEAETLDNIAQFNIEGTPFLLWTRVAGSGMDDVLILNVNGGAITTVLHPVVLYPSTGPGVASSMKWLPARVEVESSSSGAITGAIAMRTAQDSRFGLVMARSKAMPEYGELSASRTINVNTTADVGSGGVTTANINLCKNNQSGCTLRAAIALVDQDSTSNEGDGKADTVNVPTGTYTLGDYGPEEPNSGTVGQPDQYGNPQYHIEIYGPINLIGAGASTTIITSANHDKVFSENSGNQAADPNSYQPPIDAYFSGITLDNGTNPATPTLQASNGAIDNLGGLMDGDTGISGYITVVNSIFENGAVPFGAGGAVFIADDILAVGAGSGGYGNGVFEADNSTFSNNVTDELGGAVAIGTPQLNPVDVPVVFSGDTFSNNKQVLGSYGASDSQTTGQGGAIAWNQDDPNLSPPESTITTSTFTGNSTVPLAGQEANGGAVYTGNAMEITDSVFTGNTAGDEGGAIYMDSYSFTAQIVGNVITGNSAKYSGGVDIQSFSSQGLTAVTTAVQDNLIQGNSASSNANTKGLGLGDFESGSGANDTVTATDNFWGCNTGANTSGCDTAAVSSQGGTLTLSPYAVVTATLNATTITEGSQITITGYLDSDSASDPLANLTAFEGVATSINISVGGSTVVSSTPNTSSSASAALSANPGSSGSGTATFTIDSATVTKAFTVTAPAPSANPQSVSLAYDSSVNITLTASGSGTITYNVATNPSHGSLSGTAPNLVYQANAGFVGTDSFTFTASNGTTGAPATVSITIDKIQPGLSLSAPARANRGTPSPLVATFTVPSGAPTPIAVVSFYSGATNLIGTASLTQTSSTTYTATLNAANLPAGQQILTASYPGDTSYDNAGTTGQIVNVIANYIWIANSNGTVSVFDPIGTPYLTSAETEGGAGVAIDNLGNIWSPTAASNSLAEFSDTGSVTNTGYTGGGLSTPTPVAIDGSSRVWVTNTNNSVSVFNSAGQPVSASAYTGTTFGASTSPLSTPVSISIDASGNLWIANSGNSTVAEILGAATPTIAPVAAGVSGNNPATRP